MRTKRNIIPLSVQTENRIVLDKREREELDAPPITAVGDTIKAIEKAAKLQGELGLGDPTEALTRVKDEVSSSGYASQANALAKIFKAVKMPSDEVIPRCETFNKIMTELPLLAIVTLGPKVKTAKCSIKRGSSAWNVQRYEAPIPVIPSTVLELARRAKAICPDIIFHLAFMPSWQKAPQEDPVLIGEVPGLKEYFMIGAWDGDKDLIMERIEDA